MSGEPHAKPPNRARRRSDLRAFTGRLIDRNEAERAGVARELHDDAVQRAAAIEIGLTRLQDDAATPAAARDEVTPLIAQVRELSDALRGISDRLYPAMLADLGICAAFRSLAQRYCSLGVDVVFICGAVPADIPGSISIALFRIAEEALCNAAKHAPGAPVRVELAALRGALKLAIHDAGPGFHHGETPAASSSLGLFAIEQRARLAGGKVRLRTRPGRGTSVLVRVPLAAGRAMPE